MRLLASDITHSYGDAVVLRRIDLSVSTGTSVAIMGPSGAGKTSLLAILGGLMSPDRGEVRLSSTPMHPRHAVCWVHQTANVFRDRTVIDNVAVGCLADGATHREARELAMSALAGVGLVDRGHEKVRLLSGGELQRVAVARALVSRRPFILADEPTGQLDDSNTDSVMGYVAAASPDRGVVIVTHDARVAERCDLVYQLSSGTLRPA